MKTALEKLFMLFACCAIFLVFPGYSLCFLLDDSIQLFFFLSFSACLESSIQTVYDLL